MSNNEIVYVNGVKCFIWYDAKGNKHINAAGALLREEEDE